MVLSVFSKLEMKDMKFKAGEYKMENTVEKNEQFPRDSVNYSYPEGRTKCHFIVREESWDSVTSENSSHEKQSRSMFTHTNEH